MFLRSLLFFLVLGLPAAAFPQNFAPDEVLVKVRDARMADRQLKRENARIAEAAGERWRRVRLPKGMTVPQALERFSRLSEVEAVQPNFYYHLLAEPNDPRYTAGSLYGLARISAPAAWDITVGSSAVVVADIDTGLRYTHEDLAANVWLNSGEIPGNGIDDDGNGFVDDYYGYDFFYNDPDPMDESGHGTHTAGTIGAVGNNGIGVAGVNWNVRLMAIKIYSSSGYGTTSAMLVNAYNYVRMMKLRGVNIRVTNNSYGGCDEACGYDQATKEAIDALGDAGIINVFAAGNNGRNIESEPFFPASYNSPSILAVANSNSADERSSSSNYGPLSVDLAAPGTAILSTLSGSDSAYGSYTGTSMAAPHVAGAAALIAAAFPGLSPASIKARLMNSVDLLDNWNGIVRTGGRLNVRNALLDTTVCTYSASPSSIAAGTKGGYFSVTVTAPAGCDFAVKSSVKWLHFDEAEPMAASRDVWFRIAPNQTISRQAEISVAGQPIVVSQSRAGIF